MAMVSTDLADKIKTGLGFSDPTSDETKGLAKAIVDELKQASVSHAPGTVLGTAPPSGGPLILGSASGGLVVGMTPATLAAKMQSEMGKPSIAPDLLGMATAISTYFITGLVDFSPGSITGTCSNTPLNPGVLVGEGSTGRITGLVGSALATLMASSMGKPGATPELNAMCTEIVDYVMSNAEITYMTGSISATCSAGGGPIIAGTGVGGTIS